MAKEYARTLLLVKARIRNRHQCPPVLSSLGLDVLSAVKKEVGHKRASGKSRRFRVDDSDWGTGCSQGSVLSKTDQHVK